MPAHIPEEPQRSAEPQAQLARAWLFGHDAPVEGGSEVVGILLEAVEPGDLGRAVERTIGLLGEFDKEFRVATPYGCEFTCLSELLSGELANCLQHAEPERAI